MSREQDRHQYQILKCRQQMFLWHSGHNCYFLTNGLSVVFLWCSAMLSPKTKDSKLRNSSASLNMSLYCVKYLFINQIYSFSNKKKWKKIKKKKKNDAWKTPLYQENSTFLNCQYLGFLMTNFTFLLCSHKILANAVEWLNSENVSCALRHTSCHR